jgi:hypothetical protein
MRVQIPAYTDHWMKGDRYGEVVKIIPATTMTNPEWNQPTRYRVKLDKSGKTAAFVAADCTEV